MSDRQTNRWDAAKALIRSNPDAVIALVAFGLTGLFFHLHPELLATLLSSTAFSAPPSGWIWVTLICMVVAQWRMYASLQACQSECRERSARDDTEKSLLRDLVANLVALATEAGPEIAQKARGLIADHHKALVACGLRVARTNPERPMPGGRRSYDAQGDSA